MFESIFARAALVTDIEFLDDYPALLRLVCAAAASLDAWRLANRGLVVRHGARRARPQTTQPHSGDLALADSRQFAAQSVGAGDCVVVDRRVDDSARQRLVVGIVCAADAGVSSLRARHQGLLIHPRGVPWTSHFWSVWGDARTNTAQIALEIVFLAHQAGLMVDAIARTIYRKLVSRRHLLEWVTAASSEASSKHDLPAFIRFMWPAEAVVSGRGRR